MSTLFALGMVLSNDQYIKTPRLTAKISVVQKTQDQQTFSESFNILCDLVLENSDPIFWQDTLAYGDVQSS